MRHLIKFCKDLFAALTAAADPLAEPSCCVSARRKP
jgi:hypothetical protein